MSRYFFEIGKALGNSSGTALEKLKIDATYFITDKRACYFFKGVLSTSSNTSSTRKSTREIFIPELNTSQRTIRLMMLFLVKAIGEITYLHGLVEPLRRGLWIYCGEQGFATAASGLL